MPERVQMMRPSPVDRQTGGWRIDEEPWCALATDLRQVEALGLAQRDRGNNEAPADWPGFQSVAVLVEMRGLEPLTPAMRTRCSSS
jgi:hypothetical protein